ncbi:MAG TPA: hypothetical protein VLC47_04110, partial [Burkholderiales bacterium]|nr:hypothetical protein [Burkholderiales bacterium]
MRFLLLIFAAIALLGAGAATAASARRPAHPDQWVQPAVRFSGQDRQRIDSWFKRHPDYVTRTYDPDGKLPPQLDRELAPSDRLPRNVAKAPLPWPLENQLSALPPGVERAIVGRHLVMFEARTSTVLDV